MKRKLMRPSAAFFPAAVLFSALFGDELTTSIFLLLWFLLQLTTLGTTAAFRNAAAREPGVRRVGRRFWGGVVQCMLGGAVVLAPGCVLLHNLGLQGDFITLIAGAFLIIIEQMFEERMFALSRNVDGALLSLISSALVLLGLMLDAKGVIHVSEIRNFCLLCGCAASVVVSIVTSLLIAPGKGFTLLPVNCGFAPKALLQELLYPAAALLLTAAGVGGIDIRHIIAGWLLWRLARTICRRTQMESKPLDWFLTIACAAFAAAACFFPAFLPYALCCCAAFICAAIMYCAPSVRLYICLAAVISINALAYLHPFTQIIF